MLNQLFYGEISAILTNVVFAIGFVLARKIQSEASPLFQNAFRTIFGTVIFFLITLFSGLFLYVFIIPWTLTIALLASVFCNVIVGDTLYLQSQKFIGPPKALSVATTNPFFTLLFSIIFLNSHFTINIVVSAILVMFGVIIITFSQKRNQSELIINSNISENIPETISDAVPTKISINILGVAFAILSAISWAIGTTLAEYSFSELSLLLNESWLTSMFAQMIRYTFAMIVLVTFAGIEEKKKPVKRTRKIWLILFLSAFLSAFLGSFFFGEAVRTTGAVFVSIMTTSLPLFVIPFSYIINREGISKLGFLGIILTFIGIIIIII